MFRHRVVVPSGVRARSQAHLRIFHALLLIAYARHYTAEGILSSSSVQFNATRYYLPIALDSYSSSLCLHCQIAGAWPSTRVRPEGLCASHYNFEFQGLTILRSAPLTRVSCILSLPLFSCLQSQQHAMTERDRLPRPGRVPDDATFLTSQTPAPFFHPPILPRSLHSSSSPSFMPSIHAWTSGGVGASYFAGGSGHPFGGGGRSAPQGLVHPSAWHYPKLTREPLLHANADAPPYRTARNRNISQAFFPPAGAQYAPSANLTTNAAPSSSLASLALAAPSLPLPVLCENRHSCASVGPGEPWSRIGPCGCLLCRE